MAKSEEPKELSKRDRKKVTPIPAGGPRPVNVGAKAGAGSDAGEPDHTECFRCGNWPCTCPKA